MILWLHWRKVDSAGKERFLEIMLVVVVVVSRMLGGGLDDGGLYSRDVGGKRILGVVKGELGMDRPMLDFESWIPCVVFYTELEYYLENKQGHLI